MKILLLSFLFVHALCFSQQNRSFSTSIELEKTFKAQIQDGLNKYHKKYRTNDFYNYNVDKNPKFESPDSLVYRLKFLTKANGLLLWDGLGTFLKKGNMIVIQIEQLKILKKSSMKGVDYINVSIDDLEPTKGNKMNLDAIENEIKRFFSLFD